MQLLSSFIGRVPVADEHIFVGWGFRPQSAGRFGSDSGSYLESEQNCLGRPSSPATRVPRLFGKRSTTRFEQDWSRPKNNVIAGPRLGPGRLAVATTFERKKAGGVGAKL